MIVQTTNWSTLIERAEAACRVAARHDLANWPLYIVRSSEAPEGLKCAGDMLGYTQEILDVMLRPFLGSRWQGRAPAMILNDGLFDVLNTNEFIDCHVVAVALHELAHLLDEFMFQLHKARELEIPAPRVAATSAQVAKVLDTNYPTEAMEWAFAYLHHPRRFGRICIHLAYRAQRAGFDAPLSRVWQPALYHVGLYAEALGDEPERLFAASIAELLEHAPPAAYLQLCSDYNLGYQAKQRSAEMILDNVLDKITDKLTGKRKTAEERWKQCVAQIVSGKEPGETVLEQAMTALNKNPDDLRAEVARLQSRQDAAAAMAKQSEAKLPEQFEKLAQQKKDAGAQFDKDLASLEEAHRARIKLIETRHAELFAIERAGNEGRALLINTADAPDVKAEIAELNGKLQRIVLENRVFVAKHGTIIPESQEDYGTLTAERQRLSSEQSRIESQIAELQEQFLKP